MEGTTRKRTRRSKRIEGTVGKGFLICLGILILLNILVPDKTMSEKENRILSSKPKLTWSGLVSGDFMMKYEDYLLLLLIMQKDKRQKYFRMMDMMEQNIKRKVPDFKMDQCISSYKITQNLKLKKLGFGGMTLPFAPYTDLKLSRFTTY